MKKENTWLITFQIQKINNYSNSITSERIFTTKNVGVELYNEIRSTILADTIICAFNITKNNYNSKDYNAVILNLINLG